jgi:hypothetical protein
LDVEPLQNVIDVKDQMKIKAQLANWWSPSSEVGSSRSTASEKEVNYVKCVWRWKWITEGEEYMKVWQTVNKALEQHPEAFPKMGPSIQVARGEGFRLVEGTEEQLMNLMSIWTPVEEWKLEVYFHSEDLYNASRRWHPD